jgi:hypothetical protein
MFYQLIIHACSEAIFSKFFSSFKFSVWSVRMDLPLCLDACGSDVRMVKWHVWTRMVLPIANIFFTYCVWKSISVYGLGGYWYIRAIWIAIFAFVILVNPIDSCYNTTFFMKLTGTNISLWCYFWIDLC